MEFLLGFLGFGEAANLISAGLAGEGLRSMAAFDVRLGDAVAGKIMRERAAKTGVTLVDAAERLSSSCQFIASLTSAGVAYAVAESVIPHLQPGQVYVDMNAAGPAVKERIAAIPRRPGVLVCDAAVMNPVPGSGHKVPISLSGDGAGAFYDALSVYGMRLTKLDAPAGAASAIKMFRSVFMKGLPQLLIEAMVPACKFGALDALTVSLTETMAGKTIEQLANTFIPRTVIHAARRAHEMADAVRTLEDMGCDASMSKATEAKLEALGKSGLGEAVPDDGRTDFREVIALLAK